MANDPKVPKKPVVELLSEMKKPVIKSVTIAELDNDGRCGCNIDCGCEAKCQCN